MTKRTPYQIGRDHGLRNLPRFSHRYNNRRYDSTNANNAYEWGYGLGQKQRIRDQSLPLFDDRLYGGIQPYRGK